MAGLSTEETVRVAAHAALEKKAIDLVVLDLQGLSSVADFFLVCSARSAPQADTIADAIRGALRAMGVRPRHNEGSAESGWLLLDYGDVVMHVFLEETRGFYALERLWGDAPLVWVEG
ncbi:MAG TPA: ribosome silencing factor [Methylomirabilota bacterium]|nr:ribosome silencing factor [Methylomirabilota bacterium]